MNTNVVLSKINPTFISNYFRVKPLAIFSYGSSVYKNKEPSDLDFIVISDFAYKQKSIIIKNVSVDFTFFSIEDFESLLVNHEISILECIYLNNNAMDSSLLSYIDPVLNTIIESNELDFSSLRKSISRKSSNSYVKAKKKLIVEDDFDVNVSKKSLWHSFRMIYFGIQICKYKKINDYQQANILNKEIEDDYKKIDSFKDKNEFWDYIHLKYKPRYNQLMSKFRLVAPKDLNNE